MVLADSHCHLQLLREGQNAEDLIARARDAGVAKILVPGTTLEDSARAVALAEAHEGVYAAARGHPHGAAGFGRDPMAAFYAVGCTADAATACADNKYLTEDPQLNARGYFVEVEHPELGRKFLYPGAPCILSATPWRLYRRPPLLGEHNKEVLGGELGLSVEAIRVLRADGVC